MDDDKLFEMVAEEEEGSSVEEQPAAGGKTSPLMGLRPWQRFVLALLFFLDVAVIGFLVLVMLGRMQF